MSDRSDRVKAIFFEAIEGHTPDQWPAFLDRACAGAAELRAEVEKLLRARSELGSFHEPPRPGMAQTVDDPGRERHGMVIGPYKLIQELGAGGMGAVWMAQQTEPVKRLVALKVIKPGMDSRQVIARFEAERQALALMDHPNIARVFDAGTTSAGRPYFVMELVKGLPLTKFCDDRRLSPRERLELFIQVCQAIQHAHQKGIIHRDIKPSNVLVALYDGRPVPKVIDFGIAKATGLQLTEHTLVTDFGAVVGTLQYMSPEQAELNQLDIDTRSDVYSLGVLLYELLTGSTPLEMKRVKEVAMLEVLRLIREEEPPKPSTRLSTTDEMPSVAACRGLELKKLSGQVRGELDWIVMKALEKDRNRRYETANGFAQDIQRYLADEPVEACPPRLGYRLRKFVRRNKGPVLAASVIVFLLAAGVVGTTSGMLRALAAEWEAVTERDAKEEARREAVAAAKAETDARRQTAKERDQKAQALQAETKARTLAMNALRQLTDEVVQQQLARRASLTDEDRRFLRDIQSHYEEFAALPGDGAEQRAIRAEGHHHVGSIQEGLGEEKEAEASIQMALGLFQGLAAEFPTKSNYRHWLARSHNLLGIVLQHTGRPKEAQTAFAEGLVLRKQLAGEFPDDAQFRRELAGAFYCQAVALLHAGRLKEAEPDFNEAIALQKQLVAKFPSKPAYRRELALSQSNLGNLLRDTGRLQKAETAYADARALLKQLVAEFPDRPEYRQELGNNYHNLGLFLHTTSRPMEAKGAYAEAIALYKQLAADFPIRLEFRQGLARSHNNLGVLFSAMGRPQDAETEYADALALRKRLASDFTKRSDFRCDLIETQHNLSMLLQTTGRLKEAETASVDNLALCKQLVADCPKQPAFLQALARGYNNLGNLYCNTGRIEKGQKAFVEVLALAKDLAADFPNVPDHQMHVASAMHNLAVLANARRDYGGARRWLDQALPYHQAALQANPREPSYRQFFRNRLFTLVESHAGTGDPTAAVKTAEQLRDLGWDPPVNAFDAACTLGLCVQIVDKTDPKQAVLYADQAMAMLGDAVTKGYRNVASMKQNRFLQLLRQRDDFRKLLAELEAKEK